MSHRLLESPDEAGSRTHWKILILRRHKRYSRPSPKKPRRVHTRKDKIIERLPIITKHLPSLEPTQTLAIIRETGLDWSRNQQ